MWREQTFGWETLMRDLFIFRLMGQNSPRLPRPFVMENLYKAQLLTSSKEE